MANLNHPFHGLQDCDTLFAMTQIYIEPKGYYNYLKRKKLTDYPTYEDFLNAREPISRLSGTPPILILEPSDISPELMERLMDAFDDYNGLPTWMLTSLPGKNQPVRTARQRAEDGIKICKILGEISLSKIQLDEYGSRESTIRKHDRALQHD
jgi:hypothetical protein